MVQASNKLWGAVSLHKAVHVTNGRFSYDANGNTLTDTQGRSFTWDFENRLTQVVNPGVGTTTFRYDPFGRRIQKSGPLGTTDYLYDTIDIVEELDGTGSVLARYTLGRSIDAPLAEFRSGTASYYHADGLGSITSLTSVSATAVDTYTYGAFGNPSMSTGTLTNPFRYTGRELDSETALYYYRARYYDPTAGRFISEDPINFAAGINFYNYAANSPLLLVDPRGTQSAGTQEAWNDYWNVGNVFQVMRARGFASEALAAAQQWSHQQNLPADSLHNGAADAFRHCFWSCTMTRYIGEQAAEIIGDQHEKAGNREGQPHNEELMDRANNLAGRTAALSCPKDGKNCWDLCTDLYHERRLFGLGAHPLDPQ